MSMRWIVGLLVVMGMALGAEEAQRVREAAAGWTEAEYIAAVTKGPARYESFSFSDVTVRVNGTVAWLTGFVDVKLVGQESFRVRTLQVYVQSEGQWQLAAHQSTRISR